ncbi:MAG: DinB family protein [Chloroflexi bacterium]|nr:DinB family protein [Chloroflexota bacterium]
MNHDAALAPLEQACRALDAAVRALPEERFLAPLRGWSARDIVAHLIGWNRHMIEASRSILSGETPAHYADAPDGYRNLNAAHAAAHSSLSRDELLRELEGSLLELTTLVQSLPPEEIDDSHGVLHYSGRPATVGDIIRSLAQDYRDHKAEIDELGLASSSGEPAASS